MKGQALENAVTAMRLGMMITSFIALLVGVYIIFNSFTIAVNQRWKEIGILRAVGVERRNINAMFLGEALCMGLVGSCVGIVAGFYIATVANKVMGSVAASVYGIVSIAVAPKLHWSMVLASSCARRRCVAGGRVDAGPGCFLSRSHSCAAQH